MTHSTRRANDNLGGEDTGVGVTQAHNHMVTSLVPHFMKLLITQATLAVGGRLCYVNIQNSRDSIFAQARGLDVLSGPISI